MKSVWNPIFSDLYGIDIEIHPEYDKDGYIKQYWTENELMR